MSIKFYFRRSTQRAAKRSLVKMFQHTYFANVYAEGTRFCDSLGGAAGFEELDDALRRDMIALGLNAIQYKAEEREVGLPMCSRCEIACDEMRWNAIDLVRVNVRIT